MYYLSLPHNSKYYKQFISKSATDCQFSVFPLKTYNRWGPGRKINIPSYYHHETSRDEKAVLDVTNVGNITGYQMSKILCKWTVWGNLGGYHIITCIKLTKSALDFYKENKSQLKYTTTTTTTNTTWDRNRSLITPHHFHEKGKGKEKKKMNISSNVLGSFNVG
jgi:hypothetical protein